jgi:hypothetical protein
MAGHAGSFSEKLNTYDRNHDRYAELAVDPCGPHIELVGRQFPGTCQKVSNLGAATAHRGCPNSGPWQSLIDFKVTYVIHHELLR